MIHICIVPYKGKYVFRETVRSIRSYAYNRTVWIYNHGDEEMWEMCESLRQADPHTIKTENIGWNQGLAKTWNRWLRTVKDKPDFGGKTDRNVYILLNDDVFLGADAIDKVAEAALKNRDKWMINARGYNHKVGYDAPHGMALCAIQPIALEKVGAFDENFFPAYYEDCDYAYRAKLAGLTETGVDVQAIHLGSQSINHLDARITNDRWQPLCHAYFRRKWGGDPGEEKYESPFDEYLPVMSPEGLPYDGKIRNKWGTGAQPILLPFDKPGHGSYDRTDYAMYERMVRR